MNSFNSGFAEDIKNMMAWRGVLGYAENSYKTILKSFDTYCEQWFPNADVLTWDIALSYLQDKCKIRDVRVDVAMIRNLGKYQILLGKNACIFPTDYFNYKTRRMPHIATNDEMERFFNATDNYPSDKRCPLLEYTIAVIFRLQYSTGMRPQEVRRLKRQDFDFINETIYIADSKRHKDRCIVVEHRIMQMCKKYDVIARNIYPETSVFFPNKNKREYHATDITRMFHKCWKMAGNSDNLEYCTPYVLRHNFATQTLMRWMEEKKDFNQYLPYLSAYMGHQTYRETSYYLHLLPARLSEQTCMDISDVIPEVDYEK